MDRTPGGPAGRRRLLILSRLRRVACSRRAACVRDQSIRYYFVQLLDGIGSRAGSDALLVIADVTRGSGHFNLAQGTVGTAVGIGASVSTVLAGYTYDRFGMVSAFPASPASQRAFVAVLVFMPEMGAALKGNEFRREASLSKSFRAHRRG